MTLYCHCDHCDAVLEDEEKKRQLQLTDTWGNWTKFDLCNSCAVMLADQMERLFPLSKLREDKLLDVLEPAIFMPPEQGLQ